MSIKTTINFKFPIYRKYEASQNSCSSKQSRFCGVFLFKENMREISNDEINSLQIKYYARLMKKKAREASGKISRFIPKKIKEQVLSTGYCLKCKTIKNLSIDHIMPISRGGTNDFDNLQCLCLPCNMAKKTTTVDYRRVR